MFGINKLKRDLKSINAIVNNLRSRVDDLENPFLFDIGETPVMLVQDNENFKWEKVRVLDREAYGYTKYDSCRDYVREHLYSVLHQCTLKKVPQSRLLKTKP